MGGVPFLINNWPFDSLRPSMRFAYSGRPEPVEGRSLRALSEARKAGRIESVRLVARLLAQDSTLSKLLAHRRVEARRADCS